MMNKPTTFEDIKINVKIKIAALWTSLMFLYIYVDYFHLYMPGMLQDILNGKVYVFDISQVFLMIALISMSMPALMIYLSIVLAPKVNRIVNIIIATIFIPYSIFNLAGVAWVHMYYGVVLEVILLGLIIHYAWKWPRVMDEEYINNKD